MIRFFLVVLFLKASYVLAEDSIILKDDSIINGDVLAFNRNRFSIKLKEGNTVEVDSLDVKSIHFEKNIDKENVILKESKNVSAGAEFSLNELGVYLQMNRREMTGARYSEIIENLKGRPATGKGTVLSVSAPGEDGLSVCKVRIDYQHQNRIGGFYVNVKIDKQTALSLKPVQKVNVSGVFKELKNSNLKLDDSKITF